MSGERDVPLNRAATAPAGVTTVLSPLVRRLVAPNPSPMTFTGTCTYIVGRGEVAVIDPGPALPEHVETLLKTLAGEKVAQIFVTHTHRDHSPAAKLLQEATGAPIIGCAQATTTRPTTPAEDEALTRSFDQDYRPAHILRDGESFACSGFTLEAVATPGHTMNHLAFALLEENALFSGDHVMAWSTSVVIPPSGSMSAYMDSLEKLRGRSEEIYWPGHGGPVEDPPRLLRGMIQHRKQRAQSILARLKLGDHTVAAITAKLYEGLDPRLARAASLSVLAHLEELQERGLVTIEGAPGLDAVFAAVE